MKRNIVKMSLVTAMLLTTGAYSGQISGAYVDTSDEDNPILDWNADVQFGYGGLNMDNINVNLFTAEGNVSTATFEESDGSYTPDVMDYEDYYQSDVFSRIDTTILGYVTGKTWPIGEPAGIKVINNDTATNTFKPDNCIMASTYQGDSNTSDDDNTTYYLDAQAKFEVDPRPVLCSSYPGSSKRFQLVLNENMMTEIDQDGYGKSIDLVFDIDTDAPAGDYKYQVFQKVTNHTGMRLDGLKVQVLKLDGDVETVVPDLNISLGLEEGRDSENIFEDYEMAFYPPGLWGYNLTKTHLPLNGFFDSNASGYLVEGHGSNTITTTTNDAPVDGNYELIYGNWLPAKWVGVGMHKDLGITGAEPVLLAYWGTKPDENLTDAPAWHYGEWDVDGTFETGFSSPSATDLAAWATDLRTDNNPDGIYVIDDIEDLPNLSLNYIVNVGEGITDKFIIRFTPKVSADQTPPAYFERDGVTRIDPPTTYNDKKGIATITPEPTFVPGSTLTVVVADVDLNDPDDATKIDTVEVNVTNDFGDVETVLLTETEAYSAIFSGTLPTVVSDSNVTDGSMSVGEGTEVTVTYNDEDNGTAPDTVTAFTTAETPETPSTGGGGGGGCTYNPNSKNFDMTFLMLMAMGLLYPFRRRFLK